MKLLHTVSALALLLTAAPSLAEEPAFALAEGTLLAQLNEEALALLSDTRPASELSTEELTARVKSLRQALRSEGLPEDVTSQLKALLKQARSEVTARDEAASQAAAEQPAAEQAAPAPEALAADETAQIQPDAAPEPDAAPQLPSAVVSLLSDTRPASELSAEELVERIQTLRQALRTEGLPADVEEQLQGLQKQAKNEATARDAAAAQQPSGEAVAEQPAPEETTQQAQSDSIPQSDATPQLPADVAALLNDPRPLRDLSGDELAARIRELRQASRQEGLPPRVREQLQSLQAQARSEAANREGVASQQGAEPSAPAADETAEAQPAPTPQTEATPQLPSNVVSLLSDTRPASELSVEELTSQVRALRQALRTEGLSNDIKEQLLALQKQTRSEVAAREAAAAQQSSGQEAAEETPAVSEPSEAQPEVGSAPDATPQLPEDVAALLSDPRPLGELSRDELTTRIRELRQASRRPELPENVREQLQSLQAQARSEASTREAAASQQTTPSSSPPATEETAQTPEAAPETSQQPEAAPQLPGNVTALLSDTRPLSELSGEELTARARGLRQAVNLEGLPATAKEQLLSLQKQARTEIEARVAAARQNKPAAGQEVAEQPAQPEVNSQPETAPQIPEEVATLLNTRRPLSELSADQLTLRILDLQQAARNAELAPDIKEQLLSLETAAQNELTSREAAASQQPPQLDAPEQPATEAAPPAPKETAQAQPEAAPQLPEDVAALLNEKRPLSELSADELTRRIRALRQASRREELSQVVRDQLRDLQQQARAEAASREAASRQTAEQAAPEQPLPETKAPKDMSQVPPELEAAPQTAPESIDAATLLSDERDASQLSPAELSARLRAARKLAEDQSLTEETRSRLTEIVKRSRRELMSRDQAAGGSEQPDGAPAVTAPTAEAARKQNAEAPPAVDQSNVQALDGNAADPQSEATARAYLQDQSAIETLTDEALRRRVSDIRDLLASNELSRDTERSVRRKLRVERDTLRVRVAERESRRSERRAASQDNAAAPTPSRNDTAGNGQVPGTAQGNNNTRVESNTQITTNNTEITTNITNVTNLPPPRVVLADRRPPEELEEREIRWRISVYRDAIRDEDYEAEERLAWQDQLEEDRRYLRRRLLQEKERRAQELEVDYDESEFEDFDLSGEWDETAPPPRDVYADEVEDEELVKVLAAPPRRKIERRYSVAEIEAKPQLRDTIARIEIDTLRFGFNEARVREEEIDKLDRLGEILERILRKNPREVFLIEGHTDAVGSDAYNLSLSRQRAEAVKEALTTYFVINPRNLQTAGFGERFLKIPTADAEEENRRVSIARATVLVGELSD